MKSDMVQKVKNNAKNIIIGFFVLVFVMGFFSKSIINLFLPKVTVETALDGVVGRELNVEGIIQAKNSYKIKLSGEVIVKEYFVKNGDLVGEGKPLFKIDKAYGLRDSSADIERLRLQMEAQELRISNLKGENNQIELKNIQAMETRLEKSRQELANQQILFDAGAIAQKELDAYKEEIVQQELDIELARLRLDEQRKQSLAAIKEAESQIKGLKLELHELEAKQAFYSEVDEDGIYHSEYSGTVADIGATKSVLPMGTVIVEIAETGEAAGLIYAVDIPERDYDFVKEAGSIQINTGDIITSDFVDITSIYKQSNGSFYRVEAEIESSKAKDFTIGQKLKGIVKQTYVIEGHNKVSKSAVVAYGGYEPGSKGNVYLLEAVEGVLGKELRAKEVPVEILAEGDNEVIVSGLEHYEKPSVILNLSYKIRDGVKVFLWQ